MKKITACAIIFIFLFSNAFAELIYLNDGSVMDAQIIERGSNEITVNDGTRMIKIPLSKIKAVTKKKAAKDADNTPAGGTASNTLTADQKKGPLFKFPPTDDELKIAQYEAYKSISAMEIEMEKIREENTHMKVIMGIGLAAILVGVIVVSIRQ